MFLIFSASMVLANEEAISPELKSSLAKPYEPNMLGVFFSLVIVICLIYATGIAYQKLIKMNPRALKPDGGMGKNEFNIISTKSLGRDKHLHVVEINDKFLVLGSTASSINLLKEFSGEEVN